MVEGLGGEEESCVECRDMVVDVRDGASRFGTVGQLAGVIA